MRRWPIRIRLTIAFTGALALVLVAVGWFAQARLAAGFAADLDRGLAQRAQDLTGPLSRPSGSLAQLVGTGFIERGESFAELQTPDGAVVESTATLRREPLLTQAQLAPATSRPTYLDLPGAPGLDEPARVLATPLDRAGRRLVLVVGDTRQNGAEALDQIRWEMLVLGPVLLGVAAISAYFVTGAALRPVEAMRRTASALSAGAAGQRLPVPPTNDEIARLGSTLNDLLDRVDEAMARERTFVADASHQLRTPLALLKAELELATRRSRQSDDLVAAVESARDEVNRLSRVTDDLLALARSGPDGLPLAIQPLDLGVLLRRVVARCTSSATGAGDAVTVRADGARRIEADPARLEHAVQNLVDNALRHGAAPVEVVAEEKPGAVEVHVRDRGPGLGLGPTDGDVFGRFVRGAGSNGAGLGLAIVAAVADAHGGSAGAVDRAGGGADVWLHLPQPPNPQAGAGSFTGR